MTDLRALSGAIAGRVRALPEVERLYPPRRTALQAPDVRGGGPVAPAVDDAVLTEVEDGVLHVEVSVAVDATAATATDAAARVAALVRDELSAAAPGAHRIVVRVASVEG